MSEAFAHAKMRELGLPIPDKYGTDFTYSQQVLDTVNRYFGKGYVAKSAESGIIKVEGRDLAKYIGQPIIATDNQSVREWYVANVRDIGNRIDETKSLEDQARQAYEMRNNMRSQARAAMADTETAKMLDETFPEPTFEELIDQKMKKKGLTREDAIADIRRSATTTNPNVNKEFGL